MPREAKQSLNPARHIRRDHRKDVTGLGFAAYSPVKKRDAYKTRTRNNSRLKLNDCVTSGCSLPLDLLPLSIHLHPPPCDTGGAMPMETEHEGADNDDDWVETDSEDEQEPAPVDTGGTGGAEQEHDIPDVSAVYDEEDDDLDDDPEQAVDYGLV
ncbi:hypothetical protein CC1G_02775 [Coprinopsis cinerea okayama7|uniref:Uncharacterized protein n=1 Tax=Coprinopsis cinerea (strain Okayama-7 / 130 / ATCC MYA-4618 / FGSC 9003) TaxID=240176 RepID=A8N005_COPC7|nr:hypothetical protein CC1G_02775 [Coprinopsis cinerea okayama7\|eukprot:XP_001828194.2 hypothetical protein CC1G_02775 [Coprinopsis cinerea okayama7\